MRLVSYGAPARERAGYLLGDAIVDLNSALKSLDSDVPTAPMSLRGFLGLDDWRELARRLLERPVPEQALIQRDTVRLGAVIPEPSKILVVAANTRSHLKEASSFTEGMAPTRPAVIAKAPSAVAGPLDDVARPRETAKMDYEVELGVVIGRRTARVSEQDAPKAIAGYTVLNDFSARDVQLAEWEENTFYRMHYLGKSFDGFCPCGPALVTADELPVLPSLAIRCWVNGELRQDSTLGDLYFGVETIVSYLSNHMTLQPGDIICMGSPAGVEFFRSPQRFLVPGDVVRCEIDGIGFIENRIVNEHMSDDGGGSHSGA